MTVQPFNKSKLIEMIAENKIDDCKKYIKEYFFKVINPVSIYFYDVAMSTFIQLTYIEFKTAFITKNISHDIIQDKKVKSIKLSDWFESVDCDFYYVEFNVKEKRTYTQNNVNYINLFRGLKYSDFVEDEQTEYIKDGLNMIWNHIKEVICSDEKTVYEYVKNWICHFLNGRKMSTALYLKGTQGAGKSTLPAFLIDCIGKQNAFKTQSTSCLTNQFNGELQSILLLVLEELHCDKSEWKKMNGALNAIITEKSISFESKGKNAVCLTNNISTIITSNESPIRMNEKDRRYCMTDISNHKAGNFEYFKNLYSYLNDETIQKAFYFECKKIANENKFDEREELIKIETSAKSETLIKNLHPLYKYIKQEYILKNKDFNIFLKDLTKDFNINSEMKNDMCGIEISRMLKEINITGKASTGNKHRYNITHDQILEIYKKHKWMHDMDEFENDQHENININYKEQYALLKDENEKLKEQLNANNENVHYEFLKSEIEKLKDHLKDQLRDKNKVHELPELIKTISPKSSPVGVKFPRPIINKNHSLKIDIINMAHKSIIDEIF